MATRRAGQGDPKPNPYQIVTDKILAMLETGVVPWRAEWIRQRRPRPQSLITRKPYRGINHLLLDVVAHATGFVLSDGDDPALSKGSQLKRIPILPNCGKPTCIIRPRRERRPPCSG